MYCGFTNILIFVAFLSFFLGQAGGGGWETCFGPVRLLKYYVLYTGCIIAPRAGQKNVVGRGSEISRRLRKLSSPDKLPIVFLDEENTYSRFMEAISGGGKGTCICQLLII